MITISLENQHVKAQVGWHPAERKGRVDLWVSIFATLRPKAVHDDLGRTLDYVSLVQIVIIESSKERKLLETLGEDIITAIDNEHHAILASVDVIIRKKKIPINGYNADCVGIRIQRQF